MVALEARAFVFSEGKFQENKDWNSLPTQGTCRMIPSEGKFQENKDWNPTWAHGYPQERHSEVMFQENTDWNDSENQDCRK